MSNYNWTPAEQYMMGEGAAWNAPGEFYDSLWIDEVGGLYIAYVLNWKLYESDGVLHGDYHDGYDGDLEPVATQEFHDLNEAMEWAESKDQSFVHDRWDALAVEELGE